MGFGFNYGAGSGSQLVAGSGAPSSVGGTLLETVLAQCTIPAGAMGHNGVVEVETLWSWNSTGSTTKTHKVYFGPISSNNTLLNVNQTGTQGQLDSIKHVCNRNTPLYQVIASSQANSLTTLSGTTVSQINVDTTQPVPIVITGKVALETALSGVSATGNGTFSTVSCTAHGLTDGDWIKASGGSAFSGSGSPNGDPLQVNKIDANTFTYPCKGVGTLSTQPTIQRYSSLVLEGYTVRIRPGVN